MTSIFPGCFFNCEDPPAPPPPPTRCEAPADWSPDRIELLSMYDRSVVEEGSWVSTAGGAQGSSMLGFYVVVYSGETIPACLSTMVARRSETLAGDWRYESDGMGRAEIENPAYFIENSSGSDTIVVRIGTTSVTYAIQYGPDYQRPDGAIPDGP